MVVPPQQLSIDILKYTKYIILIGVLLYMIGMFLPYYTISLFGTTASKSLADYNGPLILIDVALALLVVLFIFKKPSKSNYIGVLIFGLIILGTWIYNSCLNINNVATDSSYSSLIQKGSGSYMHIIGAIIILLGASIALTSLNKKPIDN